MGGIVTVIITVTVVINVERRAFGQLAVFTRKHAFPLATETLVGDGGKIAPDSSAQHGGVSKIRGFQCLGNDVLAEGALHQHGDFVVLQHFFDELTADVVLGEHDALFDDIRGVLLDRELQRAGDELQNDRAAHTTTPHFERMLHGVVAVGGLSEVKRVAGELLEESTLVDLVASLADALLDHTEAVGVLSNLGKRRDNGTENEVQSNRRETNEDALDDVRTVGVRGQLEHTGVQVVQQDHFLFVGGEKPDESLQGVSAATITCDVEGVGGQAGQNTAALHGTAGVEELLADVIAVLIAHHGDEMHLGLLEDETGCLGMTLAEEALEVAGSRRGLGELDHANLQFLKFHRRFDSGHGVSDDGG